MMTSSQTARRLGLTMLGMAGTVGWTGQQARPERPDTQGMRPALGIRLATDEALKLAVQFGVRDVIIYGGPVPGSFPG